MKLILTLTILIVMLAIGARAQISYVDTTTLHTNTATGSGNITIPGTLTNQPYAVTNATNITVGDSILTASGKWNADIYYLYTYLLTNDFGGATVSSTDSSVSITASLNPNGTSNYDLSVMGGGGTSNAIPIVSGGGTNLTVTNVFSLVSTTPYYTISSFNPTNLSGPNGNYTNGFVYTNYSNPLFLTNSASYFLTSMFSPTCTNAGGTFYTNLNYPLVPVLTNTCGFVTLTNHSGTNYMDAYNLAPSLGMDIYTNDNGFVVFSDLCPNSQGPYYAAPAYGANAMTNACGNVLYINQNILTTNYLYGVTSISVLNLSQYYYAADNLNLVFIGTNSSVHFLKISGAGDTGANQTYYNPGLNNCSGSVSAYIGITDSSYSITNIYDLSSGFFTNYVWYITHNGTPIYYCNNIGSYCMLVGNPISWTVYGSGTSPAPVNNIGNSSADFIWAQYTTNAWRFYDATNGGFFNETFYITGSYSQQFYVTNITRSPDTNMVYLSNNGNQVQFNNGIVGYVLILDGIHYDTIPVESNLTFIISESVPPMPDPTVNYPSGNPPGGNSGCPVFISITLGGICKTLTDGISLWQSAHTINQITGLKNSYLQIDSSGTATLYLSGSIADVIPWSSPYWTTNEVQGECESCVSRSIGFPCKMY